MRPAIRDVLSNGSREKNRLLGDHTDLPSERLGIHIFDVISVDEDSASGWAVKSKQDGPNG
jgi:hypothetical protein